MTPEEKAEHAHLINLWNASEPLTPEQMARLEQLDDYAAAQAAHTPNTVSE